ncbi:MAG: phosphate ABC transporter substrate-binding protein [Chitinivorax sp.]|jgi:ABC-type phosphate transport system substrate-binding protein
MYTLGKSLLCAALIFGSEMAHSELAVIVSARHPLSSLRIDQVEQLFLGKFFTFPDGSQAQPLDLPKGAERDRFYQHIASRNSSQMKAYWSKIVFSGGGQPPREVPSPQEAVSQVSKNLNLIAYVDKAQLNSTVKVLLIVP